MMDQLLGMCFTLLAAAVAIYTTARLIESVAGALVIIVASIGGLIIVTFALSQLLRRHRRDRW